MQTPPQPGTPPHDPAELDRQLRAGLGRPALYLAGRDAAPYRDVLLRNCLHNTAYDVQCEGSRAEYMLAVIRRTNEPGYYEDRILSALVTAAIDDDTVDDTLQLCDFARLFAAAGDDSARQLLYGRFNDWLRQEAIVAPSILIKLDGLEALRFMAIQIAEHLPSADAADELLELMELAAFSIEQAEVEVAVEQAAATSPTLAALLETARIEQQAPETARAPRVDFTSWPYTEVRPFLVGQVKLARLLGQLSRWGEVASEADLCLAASDLLAIDDRDQLKRFVRIFWKRSFPLAPDPLFTLALDEDSWVSEHFFTALKQIAHPAVRSFALELLAAGRHQGGAVGLLERNYAEGDAALIERAFNTAWPNEGELHALGYSIVAVDKANPRQAHVPSLLMHYEVGPCSLCRDHTVERLQAHDALPEWLIAECAFDASEDLRTLSRQHGSSGGTPKSGEP